MIGWILCSVVTAAPPAARVPVDIQVHDGLGTRDAFAAWGRVQLADDDSAHRQVERSRHVPGPVRNSLEMARAFTADGLPQADVVLTVAGRTFATRTDDDGWYELSITGLAAPLPVGPLPLEVSVVDPRFERTGGGTGTLHVLAPGGVIIVSDIDDTVVQTHVTDKSRMVRQALTRGAADLEPVPGVAEAFGRALKAGAGGVVYVSGSPRNLQPRLRAFLEHQQIAPGPLLLKDPGKDDLLAQEQYKRRRIDALLERLPATAFVLVGDDGERDPEIYRALRERHPGRRFEVVIRATAGTSRDDPRVGGMRVVRDYLEDPDVVANAVKSLRAPRRDGGF